MRREEGVGFVSVHVGSAAVNWGPKNKLGRYFTREVLGERQSALGVHEAARGGGPRTRPPEAAHGRGPRARPTDAEPRLPLTGVALDLRRRLKIPAPRSLLAVSPRTPIPAHLVPLHACPCSQQCRRRTVGGGGHWSLSLFLSAVWPMQQVTYG